MIAFVWVLVQELIMGEGIITKFKSAQSVGEVFPLIVVGGTFFLGTFALTAYIAVSAAYFFSSVHTIFNHI